MSKVRVYELAKELGLESKELLAKLQEVGEFVRSASSTVEAPVLRKLMDKFPDLKPIEDAPKPAKKAAAKKTTKKEPEINLADIPKEILEKYENLGLQGITGLQGLQGLQDGAKREIGRAHV